MGSLFTMPLTIFSGLVIFIFSQMFVVLFLERIRTQARCVEDVAQALVIYANVFTSPMTTGEAQDWKSHRSKASEELRRLSALLRSTAQTLRYYKLWENLGLVMARNDIIEASSSLMFLSNSCQIPAEGSFAYQILQATEDHRKKVERCLKISIEPTS